MTRQQRQYMRLKLSGQCVKCRAKLEETRESVICPSCQQRDTKNHRDRRAA